MHAGPAAERARPQSRHAGERGHGGDQRRRRRARAWRRRRPPSRSSRRRRAPSPRARAASADPTARASRKIVAQRGSARDAPCGAANRRATSSRRLATATFRASSAHAAPFGSTRLPPRQRPTEPVGLYDPGYEHDACGVAFVARLSGEPSHETVQRAITALENLEHRGAAGADPNTGDGAGMLLQLPDELLRGADRRRAAAGRAVRRRGLLPPAGRGAPRRARAAARRHGRGRGPAHRHLARHPGREGLRRHHRQLVRALHQAARRRRLAGARGRPGRVRAQALRDPPRRRAGRRAGPRDPVVLEPHDRLQGHAHGAAAARLLPRPAGPAHEDRARARALALLDQHVPELGARAPVPLHRAQRRDQHAARQRQLDARARVAARLRAVRRRPREGAAGRAARRLGLGDVRQRARAARARRPQPPARADDDGAGGVGGARRPARAPARVLRVPLVRDGAVGRPGGDLASPTAA